MFPIWARLEDGYRVFPITGGDVLFPYLDQQSQRKWNCLIFERRRNVRTGGFEIWVTHFGPFGKVNSEKFEKVVVSTMNALGKLKERWNHLNSKENEKTEKENQEDKAKIIDELATSFWAIVSNFQLEIKTKLEDLKDVIERVYDNHEDKEAAEKLKVKLTLTAAKVTVKVADFIILRKVLRKTTLKAAKKAGIRAVVKGTGKAGGKAAGKEAGKAVGKAAGKEAGKAVGKAAGKEAGKAVGKAAGKEVGKAAGKAVGKAVGKAAPKAAGKAAVKKVPVLGAVFGVGFGIWRLCQGDVVGAGLEVASGAASCFPGAGTAASFAIDAALLVKDVSEAVAEIDQHFKVSPGSN